MSVPPVPIHVPDPEAAARSALADFLAFCARETGNTFPDWETFHRWSAACWADFWRLFLRWSAPDVEGEAEPVCVGQAIETAAFFPGLLLSYAGNLLRPLPGDDDAVALVSRDE